MGRNLGFFLLTLGLFFLAWRSGYSNFIFGNAYSLPLIFILFGFVSIMLGLIPRLLIFKGFVFMLFISSLILIITSSRYSIDPAKSVQVDIVVPVSDSGLSLVFDVVDITISSPNDSFIIIRGFTSSEPDMHDLEAGSMHIKSRLGSIDVASFPVLLDSFEISLDVGQVIFSTGGSNFTSSYSVAFGSYSAPPFDSCSFCSGISKVGSEGITVFISIGLGDILVR